eukprot:TRINITY_DN1017_c0_g1_i4.p1 TRINITY_DN1017_c0_g1~~TRINITY_DN1017_c0_g1_i4.p1  ORF type:complete len:585 (+),score=64.48 TRINITY_DN1017_c0_g1_i4:30-1784(+)
MNLVEETVIACNGKGVSYYTNSQTVKREDYRIIESFQSLPSSADDSLHETGNTNENNDNSEHVSKSKLIKLSTETCYDKKDDKLLQCSNYELAKVNNTPFEQSVNSSLNKSEPKIPAPCDEKQPDLVQDTQSDVNSSLNNLGPELRAPFNEELRKSQEQSGLVTDTQSNVNSSLDKPEPEFLTSYNEGPRKSQIQSDLVTDIQSIVGQCQPSNDYSWQISDTIPGLMGFSISSFTDGCTKGCSWSPTGRKLVVAAEDARYRIYDCSHILANQSTLSSSVTPGQELVESVMIKESEMVYDWAWLSPTTQGDDDLLLSTGRYQPIHLWNTHTGRLLESYKCFDQVDEVTSAYSICPLREGLQLTGDAFVAGLKNEIRMFRLSRPGREYQSVAKTTKRDIGRLGIVSCLDYDLNSGLLAAGSYNKTVNIFHVEGGHLFDSFDGGHFGGITQVKFSPDGSRLYTGARKDDQIHAWEMRQLSKPIFTLNREVSTNQRIEFDITPHHVISGGTDGVIRVWDVGTGDIVGGYMLHPDSVPGCSVHPRAPILATTSGQRHALNMDTLGDQDEDNERSSCRENSMKIWNFGVR